MKYRVNLLATILGSILISACATVATDPLADALGSGFEVVDGGALTLIGDSGVTYRDVDGGWLNYLSADGRKVVKALPSGELTKRSWRTDENGIFCQELAATGKEQCEGEDVIYMRDSTGTHIIIMNGKKMEAKFTTTAGNPENL